MLQWRCLLQSITFQAGESGEGRADRGRIICLRRDVEKEQKSNSYLILKVGEAPL